MKINTLITKEKKRKSKSTAAAKPTMQVIYSLPFSFECGQRSVAVLNGRIWCAVLKQDAGKVVGSQRDYCVVLKVS